jgi:hypothetical protein
MAIAKAPLFGLDASGTIAGSIVFSKWKGRNYVRRHAVPSNPQSGLQVGMRAGLKFTTQNYASLSSTVTGHWKTIADKTLITPLNAQVSASQKSLRENFGPIYDPTSSAGTAPDATATQAATDQTKSLVLAWTAGTHAPEYGWMIFRKEGGAVTPDISNMIAIVPAATLTYTDRDLTTGTTYYYKINGCNNNGDLGTASSDFNGTPT